MPCTNKFRAIFNAFCKKCIWLCSSKHVTVLRAHLGSLGGDSQHKMKYKHYFRSARHTRARHKTAIPKYGGTVLRDHSQLMSAGPFWFLRFLHPRLPHACIQRKCHSKMLPKGKFPTIFWKSQSRDPCPPTPAKAKKWTRDVRPYRVSRQPRERLCSLACWPRPLLPSCSFLFFLSNPLTRKNLRSDINY